jgi:hypothetical protein
MAKPRPKKATETVENPLLVALKFLEPVAAMIGAPYQTHCQIRNKTAMIFNGTTGIGVHIDNELTANPHLLLLISALSKCKKENMQMVQLEGNQLAIKSGTFQAYIPCLADELFAPVLPDVGQYSCSETVKKSLEVVAPIAQENAPRIMLASVVLRSGSAIATDGIIIFEHWHGVDMPQLVLPKISVAKLVKITKPIVSFGVSQHETGQFTSVTFWFNDGSWFKSQLYTETMPDFDRLLSTPVTPWPTPIGLWTALETVKDFTDDNGRVYLEGKTVRTHQEKTQGALYEIEGSLPTLIFDYEYLSMFAPHATHVDFTGPGAVFQGPNFRGILARIGNK